MSSTPWGGLLARPKHSRIPSWRGAERPPSRRFAMPARTRPRRFRASTVRRPTCRVSTTSWRARQRRGRIEGWTVDSGSSDVEHLVDTDARAFGASRRLGGDGTDLAAFEAEIAQRAGVEAIERLADRPGVAMLAIAGTRL